VNRKFARAVASEAKTKAPIVLVQDYHFALLPRMIREELPDATIITFWHIPWPNPESFSICPWGEEVLAGLLGSSILGFHTQFHCNNFVDTVDRLLEARVDRESFNVSFGGKLTAVRRYPHLDCLAARAGHGADDVAACRSEILRQRNSLPAGAQTRHRRGPAGLHQGHCRALSRH
jgi:trehalose 6-phosphate synthase